MKSIRIVFLFFIIFIINCSKKEGTVITYPPIPGLETSDIYQVKVNGQDIWTEKLRTDFDLESLPEWFTPDPAVNRQQEVHITNFSFNSTFAPLLCFILNTAIYTPFAMLFRFHEGTVFLSAPTLILLRVLPWIS